MIDTVLDDSELETTELLPRCSDCKAEIDHLWICRGCGQPFCRDCIKVCDACAERNVCADCRKTVGKYEICGKWSCFEAADEEKRTGHVDDTVQPHASLAV